MTEAETQKHIEQVQQDIITLDYTKWTNDRRIKNLPVSFDLWNQERDAVLARRERENNQLRDARVSKMHADREAEAVKRREESEAQLKGKLKAAYLRNPAATEKDFEQTYPQLRSEYLQTDALREDQEARDAQAQIYRNAL